MKNYSKEIAQAIRDHLRAKEIKLVAFDENTGYFGFVMNFPGRISFVHYVINVYEDAFMVSVYSPISPDCKDHKALAALSEFICRVNYDLKNGNFELDFRDGELRYKCYVNCDGVFPSDNVIGSSIGVSGLMMDKYLPGIIEMIFHGMGAEEAVDLCEGRRIANLGARLGLKDDMDPDVTSARRDASPGETTALLRPDSRGDDTILLDTSSPESEEVVLSYEEFLRMEKETAAGEDSTEEPTEEPIEEPTEEPAEAPVDDEDAQP